MAAKHASYFDSITIHTSQNTLHRTMRLLLPVLGALGALASSIPTGIPGTPAATALSTSLSASASSSSSSSPSSLSPLAPVDCTRTITIYKWPTFTNGPTLTVWVGNLSTSTVTTTQTSSVDCSSCAYVTAITKSRGGHGPVVHHTATVTSQAPSHAITTTRTQTVYVCSETNEPMATTQSPMHIAGMPAQVY